MPGATRPGSWLEILFRATQLGGDLRARQLGDGLRARQLAQICPGVSLTSFDLCVKLERSWLTFGGIISEWDIRYIYYRNSYIFLPIESAYECVTI